MKIIHTKIKKAWLLCAAVFLSYTHTQAQHNNELYVQGDMFIQQGADVYVMGDVHIKTATGSLSNSGMIEVQGNFIKDAAAAYRANHQALNSGVVEFRNNDVNTTQSQYIDGDMTGLNSFFDLIIDNQNPTNADRMVYLRTASAAVTNRIVFTNGRVRTDAVSRGNDGSAYLFELYHNNTTPANLSGHAMSGVTRYVEGRLSRQVSGAQTYDFPIGVDPAFLDGEEAFRLRFTSAPNDKLTSFFRPATQPIITTNRANFDMGQDPLGYNINDPFSACIGGPDGVLDQAQLDLDRSHEWVINKAGAVNTFQYGIDVFPGVIFDPMVSYRTVTCGGNTQTLKWLAKDGVPAGTPVATAGTIFPPYIPYLGWGTSATPCPPTGNTINNQVGFSTFRLHGATPSAFTILPIAFTNLAATPVDNRFIRVDWTTSKEVNVANFEIERSLDGVNFQQLTTHSAAGNSNTPSDYFINDYAVLPGQDYYYRIKTIFANNSNEHTRSVVAALSGQAGEGYEGAVLFPNPVSSGNVNLNIASLKQREANIQVYNTLGQLLHTQAITMQTGVNQYQLPTNNWAAATYIVKIIAEDFSSVKEFVKRNY